MKYFLLFILASSLMIAGCSDDPTGPNVSGKINVNGKAINQAGYGISNTAVSIGDSVTVTDANGNFTINDVTVPYDVKIIAAANTGIVYKGLTTGSPQLYVIGGVGTSNSANLTVSIPALTANQRAVIIFTDQAHIQSQTQIFFPTTSSLMNVTWPVSSTSVTGKIIVFVYTISAGHVLTYDKYGEKTGFTLNNGVSQAVTFAASELTLDPGESTISGTVTAPSGYINPHGLSGLTYITTAPNSLSKMITFDAFLNSTAFNFVVPTGLPTPVQYVIGAYATGTMNPLRTEKFVASTAPATNVNMVLETSSVLAAPLNAATDIDTTTSFSYSAAPGSGIYLVSFNNAGRNFYVITPAITTTIPNLNAFGLGIGSSTVYTWFVTKYNNITSTDTFVSTPLDHNPLYTSKTISMERTFTTKP